MPILTIQRRMSEQGRIRLGRKAVAKNGKTYPEKLDKFRFTSANQRLIEDIAGLYGGQATEWDNAGKAEWEVFTDSRSIPVLVVKGGFSQWMESWSRGGCDRRCDGVTETLSSRPCLCAAHDEDVCKPTTRLSVMLRDLETLGLFRLESKGWNAAAELPSMAELAMTVAHMVPATLHLVQRTSIRDGKTKQFVVPVLDLEVSKERLVAIAAAASGSPVSAIESGPTAVPAIGAAPAVDYLAMVGDCMTSEDCRALWTAAGDAGALSSELKTALATRVGDLQQAAALAEPAVDDAGPEDTDFAWTAYVAAAGGAGMTDADARDFLEQRFGQPVDDLTADQLMDARAAVKVAG